MENWITEEVHHDGSWWGYRQRAIVMDWWRVMIRITIRLYPDRRTTFRLPADSFYYHFHFIVFLARDRKKKGKKKQNSRSNLHYSVENIKKQRGILNEPWVVLSNSGKKIKKRKAGWTFLLLTRKVRRHPTILALSSGFSFFEIFADG
jgi:hypothetical protein